MRDHRKLKVFQEADELALDVYQITAHFPKEELFGLTSQMRRASVSIVSNIVEGCARQTLSDYLHFLDMAFASARELAYQCSLAFRLKYMSKECGQNLEYKCEEVCKMLCGLTRSLRAKKNSGEFV
ncbi:MAG TPA: four helix bundle protein [Candidatus Hydrogenedentes bacterium]|nr:four helix bundle protein [Candidatus Hydrogenedentota bacterium]